MTSLKALSFLHRVCQIGLFRDFRKFCVLTKVFLSKSDVFVARNLTRLSYQIMRMYSLVPESGTLGSMSALPAGFRLVTNDGDTNPGGNRALAS